MQHMSNETDQPDQDLISSLRSLIESNSIDEDAAKIAAFKTAQQDRQAQLEQWQRALLEYKANASEILRQVIDSTGCLELLRKIDEELLGSLGSLRYIDQRVDYTAGRSSSSSPLGGGTNYHYSEYQTSGLFTGVIYEPGVKSFWFPYSGERRDEPRFESPILFVGFVGRAWKFGESEVPLMRRFGFKAKWKDTHYWDSFFGDEYSTGVIHLINEGHPFDSVTPTQALDSIERLKSQEFGAEARGLVEKGITGYFSRTKFDLGRE